MSFQLQGLKSEFVLRLTATAAILGLATLELSSCARQLPKPARRNISASPPPITQLNPTPLSRPASSVPPVDAKESARFRQLGLQYRSQGNYDEAIAALRHSVALDPTHLEGRVILGWTLHLAEQPTVAMEVLQQAVIRAPDDVSALNALGIVYLVKGNLSQAVDTHERAIALDPKNEIAHYNLSLAYQRLQQSAAAIAYARTATALEPGNPHPWMALAIAQWGAGNVEAAQQAYRQALQLDSRYASEPFLSSLEVAGFNARQIEAAAAVRAS